MEWIPIKSKHMLFSPLSMSERGILTSIQALAAHLERIPSEHEIMMIPGVGRKAYASLTDKLRMADAPLSNILRELNEIIKKSKQDRESARTRMAKLRTKSSNVTPNIQETFVERSRLDKIRGEKRREDNINIEREHVVKPPITHSNNYIKSIDPKTSAEGQPFSVRILRHIHSTWPRSDRKDLYKKLESKVYEENILDCDNNKELHLFMHAFSEYMNGDDVKDGVVSYPYNWAPKWRDYIPKEMEPFPEDFEKEVKIFESLWGA